MNHLNKTIIAFAKLGNLLSSFRNTENVNDPWSQKLNEAVFACKHKNGWFTQTNVVFALESWGALLTEEHLKNWLNHYPIASKTPKTVALIMAGNIPLVGFHDFLCTIVTGNKALIKLSDSDAILLPLLTSYLIETESSLADKIIFEKGKLPHFDAVIATGSNNTARYFEYYFGKKPNIIRKNRSSVAIIQGNETPEQMEGLSDDVFRYFGLGCRSVSKIFIPTNFNFDFVFNALFKYKDLINEAKYSNNYDYNKAVYLMSNFKILDNGFVVLKEDEGYHSPIASLNYEYYSDINQLKIKLENDKDSLQCIVANNVLATEIPFGKTQIPQLNDYADGIDTVDFLLKNTQN